MKLTIEVKDREEARQIEEGLSDPVVRAFVCIVGALRPFSPRARERMLRYVMDRCQEENESAGSKP